MNVIIQAGGLGSRLGKHTQNKPKCLVEFNGKTLLERQLEVFKGKKIFVIGDYKFNVLKAYVETFFSDYQVTLVDASAKKGTLAGLNKALSLIPAEETITYVWSDLVFDRLIEHNDSDMQIFTTSCFSCRYRLDDHLSVIKETSKENGIIGAFTVRDKSILESVPDEGSFVGEWLKNNISSLNASQTNISFVREVGEQVKLEKHNKKATSRFFNSVMIGHKTVIKKCIDRRFSHLLIDEKSWYKKISSLKFQNAANIISYEPFILEKIDGFQCHKMKHKWDKQKKGSVLEKVCQALHKLHSMEAIDSVEADIMRMYKKKTLDRVNSVKQLIPFFDYEVLNVNGKNCINPFAACNIAKFLDKIDTLTTKKFSTIHGDPTFNNFMFSNEQVVFYDPRGCFSKTKIYGDSNYDWAKLYYSVVENYDSVNEKRFTISYNKNNICYDIESNGWEFLEDKLVELSLVDKNTLIFINCLIWFSLCGYVVDYDSILISFVKGVDLWQKIF